MKSYLHSVIPFLPSPLKSPSTASFGTRLNSVPLLLSSYPGRLVSTRRSSTNSNDLLCPLCNHSAPTMQKTQSLYCWHGVFTAPFHSQRKLIDCCLRIRCLVMDVSSDFTITVFSKHFLHTRTCWTWGSYSGDHEKCNLLGQKECDPAEIQRRFGGTYCLYVNVRKKSSKNIFCLLPIYFNIFSLSLLVIKLLLYKNLSICKIWGNYEEYRLLGSGAL
jgi:hypothetical protein